MNDISWYISPQNPNLQQNSMLEHIVSRAATDLTFFNRSNLLKDVTSEIIWNFELGLETGVFVQS